MSMLKRNALRKYLPFTKAGIQATLSYRTDFFLYRFGDVLTAFVTFFVWQAVFMSSKTPNLNGFNMSQMTVYIFMSFLVTELSSSGGSWTIGEEVKDGSIAMRMIKPISFTATYLFEELGHKLVAIGIIAPPLLGGIIVYQLFNPQVMPFNFFNLILLIISVLLAYFISFYFNICYGFTAFVFKNLWGSNVMKHAIMNFMSGTLIPLAFFPETVGHVLQFFPFASLIYTPVMIYMGKYSAVQLVQVIGLQVFWMIFFVILSKIIWKLTVKHLSVQGG